MPVVPDGVFRIVKPDLIDQGATVIIASAPPDPNTPILILPLTSGPESRWKVENKSDGTVTMQNLATYKYLGFEGKPFLGKICEQTSEPVKWRIQPTKEKGKFHIVVPGGPVNGSELAFDASPVRVFPPLTALVKLRLDDIKQTWSFVSLEN